MIDEMHLSEWRIKSFCPCCACFCHLHLRRPQEFMDEAHSKHQQSARVRCFGRLARHLYRCRFCWYIAPIVIAVTCMVAAVSMIEVLPGLPSIFPDEHNMNAGALVMEQFKDTSKAL